MGAGGIRGGMRYSVGNPENEEYFFFFFFFILVKMV